MSTVNKIINGLILVAAIFCSIFSYYMHQQRIELRNRADYLAQTAAQVAKVLDGQGKSTTELNLSNTLNEDFFSWQSYRQSINKEGAYTAWENKADSLRDGAESIISMKLEMAEGYMKIAEALQLQNNKGRELALNSVHTYQAHIDAIKTQSELVYHSNLQLTSSLNEVAHTLGYKVTIEELEPIQNPQRTKEKAIEIIKATAATHSHKNALAEGLNQLAQNIPTKDKEGDTLFQPTWTKHDFNSHDPQGLQEAFKAMIRDSHNLHQKLFELKIANKIVENQRHQLSLKENIIEGLNTENDELKNNNGRLNAQIKRLKKQVVSSPQKSDVAIQAKITEVNDRFKFVIINKGKNDGITHNRDMIIHNDGKFICKVRVTKVLADKAICDILPGYNQKEKAPLPPSGSSAVTTN